MNYVIAIGIFIAILMVTFILLIFMPKPMCYYDIDKTYPELKIIEKEEYFNKIIGELLKDEHKKIKLIYSMGKMEMDPDTIPITFDLLKTIPYIKSVFLATVESKSNLPKRRGSSSFANNTIRCILPLKISSVKKTGIWTDGEIKLFQEGKWVLYDDSRENQIFNNHKYNKLYLLVLDVDRPDIYPMGISTIEHDILF